MPESLFGKNQTLVINKGTTKQDLFAFRNIRFGAWTKEIDNALLLQGIDDYKNGEETEAAEYYEDTIKLFGGALVSKNISSSTPTTTADELTDDQKLIRKRRWIESAGGKFIGFYGLIGQKYEVMVISEFDELTDYMSVIASAIIGKGVTDIKTVHCYTGEDVKIAATKALSGEINYKAADS